MARRPCKLRMAFGNVMSSAENLHVLERFRALCQADPRVAAAFAGGSLATGTADEYSDLDLYLIVADEAYAEFFADRAHFLRQLGEPVFQEDFAGFGFDMILFILADGAKGELGLAQASHFRHIHGGPYRVLVDKPGLLAGVSFPLDRIAPEAQRRTLAGLLGSFWRHLDLLTGALGRGRLLTAMEYLGEMRRALVGVSRLAVDFADGGGHPPAEALLSEQALAALGATFAPFDRREIGRAAQEAVRLFTAVARPLAGAQGVPYPEALERVVRARFERLAGAAGR